MEILYLCIGLIVFGAITALGRLVLGALGWEYFEPHDILVCFLAGMITCGLLAFGEMVGKALCQ